MYLKVYARFTTILKDYKKNIFEFFKKILVSYFGYFKKILFQPLRIPFYY